MKRNERRPVSLSSSTSEPRMSAGIRSGVHWMRLSSRPRIVPRVSTSRVLASPGTPINSACPPDKSVISACSTTSRCPKMISPTRSRTSVSRSPSASTSATRSAGPAPPWAALKGVVDTKPLILFQTTALLRLMEKPASGNASPAGRPGPRRPQTELGELDMRIARDGTWYYRGSPINRIPLVKLFASVLRREADGSYWLVTPAERGRVIVECVPFVAVAVEVQGTGRAQQLIFRTNLDDIVTAGRHPGRRGFGGSPDPAEAAAFRHAMRGYHDLNPGVTPPSTVLTPAAVLVPLIDHRNGMSVLLTQRTAHLTAHAGQISFPGGRIEESDADAIAAALRETEEEVGLPRDHVRVIGRLDTYVTGTGFEITPVVGIVSVPFPLAIDPFEVSQVFEAPRAYVVDQQDHRRTTRHDEHPARVVY